MGSGVVASPLSGTVAVGSVPPSPPSDVDVESEVFGGAVVGVTPLELDPLEPELLELDRLEERPSTVLEFPLSTAESLRNVERRQSPTPSGAGPSAAATASASTRRPASVG